MWIFTALVVDELVGDELRDPGYAAIAPTLIILSGFSLSIHFTYWSIIHVSLLPLTYDTYLTYIHIGIFVGVWMLWMLLAVPAMKRTKIQRFRNFLAVIFALSFHFFLVILLTKIQKDPLLGSNTETAMGLVILVVLVLRPVFVYLSPGMDNIYLFFSGHIISNWK